MTHLNTPSAAARLIGAHAIMLGTMLALGPSRSSAQAPPPQTASPKGFDRPASSGGFRCPPVGVVQKYHWTDTNGDDLAVVVTCEGGALPSFHTTVTQSQGGRPTAGTNEGLC